MPRRCSEAGCRSNYDGESESVSTFTLPVDASLRKQWLSKIPTDLSRLKNPIVCIKQFSESDIILVDKCIVKGEIKEFPRKIPKLKTGALPKIFPNLPKYLSSAPSSSRRLQHVEEERIEDAIKESLKTFKAYNDKRLVNSLEDLVMYYNSVRYISEWTLLNRNGKVYFCYVDVNSEIPVISCSVVIDPDLSYVVFVKKKQISLNKLPYKLHKISSTNILDEILIIVKTYITDDNNGVDAIIDLLKEINVCDEETIQISFMIEQLKLGKLSPNNRRYSGLTLLLAAKLYCHSSSGYWTLYNSKCMFLPHPRNLQKVICRFSLFDSGIDESVNYLSTKLNLLKDYELIVNLHIDEIYVAPELNFKAGSIFGASTTTSAEVAKTIQVFMISSLFSKYKDVVSLVPVSNLTAQQLKDVLCKTLIRIETLGFKVIAVVSDNNVVNRKCFELFTSNNILQPAIPPPVDQCRKLFFVFDTVHIIKCIRNNWISNKSANCSLKFPDFNDCNSKDFLTAEFQHLQQLYELEKNSLVKFGHLLSYKSLYPSNIQKQNVKLVLDIFSEKNIVALKYYFENKLDVSVTGTCKFLDIVCTWWKIVNVKSCLEGKRFNDKFREAIRKDSTTQIEFLKNMSHWLKIWRLSVPIKDTLSSQTFQSLINTIDAFLLMIPYMFTNYKIDYILLSKFQNDVLEGRFGNYRQLSGGNYYISVMQVLESERKLRFQDAVRLCSKGVNIPLTTLLPDNNESLSKLVDIGPFKSVLYKEFVIDELSNDTKAILLYIAGFITHKKLRLRNCNTCKIWLQSNKEIDIEGPHNFTLELDRGKLKLPSEFTFTTVAVTWFALSEICNCNKDLFLSSRHQLSILHKICVILVEKYIIAENGNLTKCNCNETIEQLLQNVGLTACKILLNNLVKVCNDTLKSDSKNSKRKLMKLGN